MNEGIATYLSHSYRREDQANNLQFWPLFEAAGFYFSVDPPSNITTTAHLEQMMNASSCYVAIVNRRPEIPKYYCSPFVLYEFGLALQARRPMLLLVDDKIGRNAPQFQHVPDRDLFFFRSSDPLAGVAELRDKIANLRTRALPVVGSASRRLIGVILPQGHAKQGYGAPAVFKAIEKAAARSMFRCERISVPMQHNAYLSLHLDRYAAVILDVRGDLLAPWVFAYVHGRLIPSLKLVRVRPTEVPASVELPPLVQGLRMDENEPGVECVIYWREADDLFDQLTQAFHKLDDEPTQLRKQRQGEIYFNAIGRSPARVFISNHGKVNDRARSLSDVLGLNSIERFQYKDIDAIKTGSDWPTKIRQELQDCHLFVALLSEGYWESEWCRTEMSTALERRQRGTLQVLPYRVDRSNVSFMGDVQVSDVPADIAQATERIFGDIDTTLKANVPGIAREARMPMLPGASLEAIIDALRHFPAPRWRDLLRRLERSKITVQHTLGLACPQPRRTVERLVNEIQRLPTPPVGRSPLVAFVEHVDALAPRPWKDSVRRARLRIGR